jgi:hypothetical protein
VLHDPSRGGDRTQDIDRITQDSDAQEREPMVEVQEFPEHEPRRLWPQQQKQPDALVALRNPYFDRLGSPASMSGPSLTQSNRRGTDPYARCCGRGDAARPPPIPICDPKAVVAIIPATGPSSDSPAHLLAVTALIARCPLFTILAVVTDPGDRSYVAAASRQ